MKRSLALVLLVGLVSACGTDEPVSQGPTPLPMSAPAGSSPGVGAPSTTLYDVIQMEAVQDYFTEWTLRGVEKDRVLWEKHVGAVSVLYDVTPDPQQACEQLWTSPTFLHGLPGVYYADEARRTVLDVLVTQGSESQWYLEGSEFHPGGGPALFCIVANDGSEQWETHLPGIEAVLFGEADMLWKDYVTGKVSVVEGWKTIVWVVVAG